MVQAVYVVALNLHPYWTLLEVDCERKTMSNLKDKAADKVDAAPKAIKKTSDKAADKSKDFAHQAGKAVEKGGKRLQDV
jgi:ElaB/YqjD/DUF883 family membrane-anchored ribosome-binding protein